MNCKGSYKDPEKYAAYARRSKTKYRERTGAGIWKNRFTVLDDELILSRIMTDRELSEKIHHSVGSIQKRRWELKNKKEIKETAIEFSR